MHEVDMSSIEFDRFLAQACETPETVTAFVQAVGDKQGDEAIQAVAAFAQAQGYDVSIDTAANARQSVLAALNADRALGDDELDSVNGGLVVETAIGVGIIAAALTGTAVAGAVTGGIAVASFVPEVSNWFKQW